MIKIRFLTNYKQHAVGDIIFVSNNIAFGLIDSKVAIKDIDYQTSQLKSSENRMMKPSRKRYKTK